MTTPESESPLTSQEPEWRPRRGKLPFVLLALLVAGAAVLAWRLLLVKRTRPDRVVVAIHAVTMDGRRGAWWGDGDRASGRLADMFAKQLERSKLEVVGTADEKAREALAGKEGAALLEAARSVESGVVLTGTVATVRALELSGSDLRDYTIEVALSVEETGEGGASAPLGDSPMLLHIAAASEDRALLEAAETIPELVQLPLAAALTGLPSVKRLSSDAKDLSHEDITLASKFEGLFREARFRAEQLEKRAEQEAEERATEARGERGEAAKHLVSPLLGEQYLIGFGPKGELVLMVEPHYVQTLAAAGAYSLRRGHERFELTDPDGKGRRLLFEAFNFFSYPTTSRDGRLIATVLDHRQWSKALTLVSVEDGAPRELLVDASDYFSGPTISPDGSLVAFWHRTCRRCSGSLDVIRADGTERRTLVPAGGGTMSIPVWSPDGAKLYLAIGGDEGPEAVYSVSVADGTRTRLLGVEADASDEDSGDAAEDALDDEELEDVDDELEELDEDAEDVEEQSEPASFGEPAVSRDGRFLVVVEVADREPYIGRLDIDGGEYSRLATIRAQRLEVSPDGATVAFETWSTGGLESDGPTRDSEIAVVPARGGDVRLVTMNSVDDNLFGWSPDGKRLYFHQATKDPSGAAYVNRVYWVEP